MNAYANIYKQAHALVRAHKFLWALGLFLIWNSVFLAILFWTLANDTVLALPDGPLILILLFFGLLAGYAYLRSRTAIMYAAKALLEKQPSVGLMLKSFKYSRANFVPVLLITFVSGIFFAIISLVLGSPVIYLWANNFRQRASILGTFGLVIFVILLLLVNLVNNIAPLYVTFFGLGTRKAINASFDTIRKFWPGLSVFASLLGFVEIAFVLFSLSIVKFGVEILGQIFYNAEGIQFGLVSSLLAGTALILFLIFGAFVAVFQQVSWTILFKDLVRPQKIEEEEPVPVPEVAA